MPNYHPLDTRYKADTTDPVSSSAKPWQKSEPKAKAWQREGPIQDDPRVEQRKRNAYGNDVEKAEIAKAPLIANLFTPAALFFQARALLRSKTAIGYSKFQIVLQIAGAIVLYFVLMNLDGKFGINQFLSTSMKTP